jgi:hypothetical protein
MSSSPGGYASPDRAERGAASRERLAATANLLLMNLQGVAVLHVELLMSALAYDIILTSAQNDLWRQNQAYRVWVVLRGYALAVEEEAHARDVLALTIAEGVHEFSESRCALDLEKNLVVVIGDLDVEMFALAAILWLLLDVR